MGEIHFAPHQILFPGELIGGWYLPGNRMVPGFLGGAKWIWSYLVHPQYEGKLPVGFLRGVSASLLRHGDEFRKRIL